MTDLRDIEAIVKAVSSPAEAIAQLVALCSEQRPHPAWASFLELDFAGDARGIERWVQDVFSASPPGEEVSYLWFGLGDEGSDLYVVGYPWDPFEEDPLASVAWNPELRMHSGVLTGFVDLAYDGGLDQLGNEAVYPLCLGYAGAALRLSLASLGSGPPSPTSRTRTVFVGFDGGDHLELGTMTHHRLL